MAGIKRNHWITLFGFILLSPVIYADVTLDGTLGPAAILSGPNFQIPSSLGTQVGGNLFHSFGKFNIASVESATFTGPNSVQNVIGRVTGGEISQIDGLISNNIPNANLYLINPAGIMFGANAQLNVQGSFHATTADYIDLSDQGRFYASLAENTVLTSAPPEAFGFLSDSPSSISVIGSLLAVPGDKTLSIVAGNIVVSNQATMTAPSGVINLISVAGAGNVAFDDQSLDVSPQMQRGNLLISNSILEVSSFAGGKVVIRGGELILESQTLIQASTVNGTGLGIDIAVNKLQLDSSTLRSDTFGDGNGGNINVLADESASISGNSKTFGLIAVSRGNSGSTGFIKVKTPELEIRGGARIINSSNCASCNISGGIFIDVTKLNLLEGSTINSSTAVNGDGAPISIIANEKINIKDPFTAIIGNTFRAGEGGSITIETPILELSSTSTITTNTLCLTGIGCGNAGGINIKAEQTKLSEGASINSATLSFCIANAGCSNAGDINIEGKQITLSDRALINSSTAGDGNGGNITLIADQNILITGVSTDINTGISAITRGNQIGAGRGNGGSVLLRTPELIIERGGVDTASTCDSCGSAGTIKIDANTVVLEHAAITSGAAKGGGGSITIEGKDILTLIDSNITTSIVGGDKNAGNINVFQPVMLSLLQESRIEANAFAGKGGNININTQMLFQSLDSEIKAEAFSKLGIDGVVEINAPETNIVAGLTPLPEKFVDVATILRKPCAKRISGSAIQFVTRQYTVLPDSPYALRSYLPILDKTHTQPDSQADENKQQIITKKGEAIIFEC